jgi:hypothetical protein
LEKSLWAIFSTAGPARRRPRPISAREPACQPVTVPPSLTDGARLSALSSPKSPLLCSAPVCPHRPNSHRRAGHPSPPRATRMAACPPATLSHHVSCDVPWRLITVARLRLLSSPLRWSNSGADRSATKSSSRPLRWPSFHCQMCAVEAIV